MDRGPAHCREDRLQPAGGPRAGPAQRRLARLAGGGRGRPRRRGQAGDPGVLGRHRAGAAHAGLSERGAGAGEVAGRGGGGPGLARRRLPGRAGRARAHRGAGPAHARRHRGAPALPQRAPDHRHIARAPRRARGQRERHRGHQRDPLRRQRPALGPRGQHDERRLPGAALRCRRALHRASWNKGGRQRRGGPPARRGARHHAGDRGHGRQRRQRAVARRHGDQDRGRQDRTRLGHQHGDRSGQDDAPAAGAARKGRRAPGSWPTPIR